MDELGLELPILGDDVKAVGATLGAPVDALGIDVALVGDSVAEVGRPLDVVGTYTYHTIPCHSIQYHK